jgi:phosphatidylserine decarboxylase
VEEGDVVERGERIGLMKFGSRMDVFLPTDMEILVAVGQRVVGGESILARDTSRPRPSAPAELGHA